MHPPESRPPDSADRVPPPAPLISLVLTGRNDEYGGDFTARFFRTLRFNHEQLKARGIPHEIVFVEWAPQERRPLLFEQIFEALPDLDRCACSWYVVDPRYQQALSLNPRLEYLEFVAKNVGIRRARGGYVLTSNCDVYLGRHILDVIQRSALQAGVLYRAPRQDLKLVSDLSTLDWDVLEDPRNLAGPVQRLKPPFMGSATGDFVLLDRETFHAIGAFNEVYRAARIGIDRNLLVKAVCAGLRIEDIGGPVYHVNHVGSYRLQPDAYAGREAHAPWGDRRWHQGGVSYTNPPTWGLAQAPERPIGDRGWYLDFSWSAVPPLVDLRRIVVPVARLGGPLPGVYRKR